MLYYINRSKARQDGHTVILCRITVDGASTVMATGEECTPEEWNVKQSETSNRKLNLRLQMLHAHRYSWIGMPWEEYYAVFNTQIYKITPYYTMN